MAYFEGLDVTVGSSRSFQLGAGLSPGGSWSMSSCSQASTPGSLCPPAGGCCASPAPPGDRPKSATALYRARIKAYFCLDEFNGNFVFKWSGSPAGFLPLEFLLSGVCVQKCCLPLASRDSNISRLPPAHPGRWGSSLQKVPA